MITAVANCFSALKSSRKQSPYFVVLQLGSSVTRSPVSYLDRTPLNTCKETERKPNTNVAR